MEGGREEVQGGCRCVVGDGMGSFLSVWVVSGKVGSCGCEFCTVLWFRVCSVCFWV